MKFNWLKGHIEESYRQIADMISNMQPTCISDVGACLKELIANDCISLSDAAAYAFIRYDMLDASFLLDNYIRKTPGRLGGE